VRLRHASNCQSRAGGMVFHVLNRGVGRMQLFRTALAMRKPASTGTQGGRALAGAVRLDGARRRSANGSRTPRYPPIRFVVAPPTAVHRRSADIFPRVACKALAYGPSVRHNQVNSPCGSANAKATACIDECGSPPFREVGRWTRTLHFRRN